MDPLSTQSSPEKNEQSKLEEVVQSQKLRLQKLKQAYLNLQKEYDAQTTRIQELVNEGNFLQIKVNEKDSQISMLQLQVGQITAQLADIETQAQPAESGPCQVVTVKNEKNKVLEQQNKKLLSEVHSISAELANVKVQLQQSDSECEELRKKLSSDDSVEQPQSTDLQAQFDALKEKYDAMKNKYRLIYSNFEETEARFNQEIDRINANNENITQELQNARQEILDKNETIKLMQKSIMKHGENEGQLAARLMEMKEQLFEAKSFYQKFPALKVGRMTGPVELVLRRGHEGEFVIDIIQNARTTTYGISSLTSVMSHPNQPNRFFITVDGEAGNKEFESKSSVKIVKQIREFMFKNIAKQQVIQDIEVFKNFISGV